MYVTHELRVETIFIFNPYFEPSADNAKNLEIRYRYVFRSRLFGPICRLVFDLQIGNLDAQIFGRTAN